MKLGLYSIYDTIAEVFNKPYTAHNDADAKRAFEQSFKSGEKANKDDYVMYKVATWNDATGDVEPILPEKMLSGFDIKKVA